MASRTPAALVLVVGLLTASCGPAADAPAAGAVPATGPRAPRAAATEPVAPPLAASEVDALLAEWKGATDAAVMERIEDRLLAAGDPALDRLVALLALGDERTWAIVELFGARAVLRLLAALTTSTPSGRAYIALALELTAPHWRDAADGPAVCRALLALLSDDNASTYAASALCNGRPASRSVAKELAEMWLRGPNEGARNRARDVLSELGADAAPAARLLLDAAVLPPPPAPRAEDDPSEQPDWPTDEDSARFWSAIELLRGIGAADPSILGELRSRLAAGSSDHVRRGAAAVLAAWGDAAAAAAPELIALLGTHEIGDTAGAALLAMRSQTDAVVAAIDAAYARGDEWTHRPGDVLCGLCRRRVIAERLLALLPTLPPDDLLALHDVLADHSECDLAAAAPRLFTNADARVRDAALRPWDASYRTSDYSKETPAPPAQVTLLLDDADARVRVHAAAVLAEHGATPPGRIRDVAAAVLRDDDADLRILAVRALGPIAAADGAARDALVATLGSDASDDVRWAAVRALALADAPIPGDHATAIAWLAAKFGATVGDASFATSASHPLAAVMLRFDGGAAALGTAVGAAIASDRMQWPPALEYVMDAVAAAGPRLAALRPQLVALRESTHESYRDRIDRALAAVAPDAEAIGRSGQRDEATVRKLLALGDAGRRGIVLLFGSRDSRLDEDEIAWLDGADLASAVAAAARTPASDPDAKTLRFGAVRVAEALPAPQAVEILSSFVDDTSADAELLRIRALVGLAGVEKRHPGAVPVELVRRELACGDWRCDSIALAESLGPRGSDLVPDLRKIRDTAATSDAMLATVALWRMTRDADEALPAIRRVLASPRATSGGSISWDDVRGVLAEVPLTKADVAAVVELVRTSRSPVVVIDLLPLLERFGSDAAPALPALIRVVAERRSDRPGMEEAKPSDDAEAAARILGAIGPAARDAIPELRRLAADTGDPRGVIRAQIALIEGAR